MSVFREQFAVFAFALGQPKSWQHIDGLRKTGDAPGHKIFSKNAIFGQFLASEASQNKEGEVPPPTPFHIKHFKIFTKSKTWPFLELETRPGRHFLTVFTMFFAPALIFTLKHVTSKIIKKSLKNQFPPGV